VRLAGALGIFAYLTAGLERTAATAWRSGALSGCRCGRAAFRRIRCARAYAACCCLLLPLVNGGL
jgi:hypothetical protein